MSDEYGSRFYVGVGWYLAIIVGGLALVALPQGGVAIAGVMALIPIGINWVSEIRKIHR